ncbi:hypothetical protein G6F24_017278 [Rhizopus arrhizus]|nr:hypothetical protein G6F24_017278 [Rhizopus arrhizus]
MHEGSDAGHGHAKSWHVMCVTVFMVVWFGSQGGPQWLSTAGWRSASALPAPRWPGPAALPRLPARRRWPRSAATATRPAGWMRWVRSNAPASSSPTTICCSSCAY